MDNVKVELKDNDLVVSLSGRIDANVAPVVQSIIDEELTKNPHQKLVIDCNSLEYVSSAGLRVFLKLQKSGEDLTLVNVAPEVYEIFDMTGFTEIIDIEKAFRKLSIEGADVIGKGSNGIVYRLDPETIIKVYFNSDALDDIKREKKLATKALVMGIPTAISYDIVKVGDKFGSVFELINSQTFSNILQQNPEKIDELTEMSVQLLKSIHATVDEQWQLPDIKETVLNWVRFLKDYLDEKTYNKLYSLVDAVEKDNHVIHGDYHVKNIMLQNDEPILIDMDTLALGNPVFEFGSIFNAYKGFYCVRKVENFLDISFDACDYIWDKTLRLYFPEKNDEEIAAVEKKAALIGYTRLLRRTIRREPENTVMIDFCRESIIRLTESLDTLYL